MKKIVKLFISLLIGCLILSPVIVNCDYQVTAGETFTYDVLNAQFEVTKGTNYISGNGYQIDGHQFPEETSVDIEVTSVDPTNNVDYSVSSDGYVELGSSVAFSDVFAVLILTVYPLLLFNELGNLLLNDLNSSVSQGTGLFLVPFWDVINFNVFADLTEESFISEITTEPEFQDLQFQAQYEEVGSEMIFDWFIEGLSNVSTVPSYYYEVEHQLKMVYDLTSGVLQGMRMTTTANGIHSGENLDYYMDFHLELLGYDLDDYLFDPITTSAHPNITLTAGFGWIGSILAINVLIIPIILRKIRKIKRKKGI